MTDNKYINQRNQGNEDMNEYKYIDHELEDIVAAYGEDPEQWPEDLYAGTEQREDFQAD